jgi:hypothetical protein
MAKRLKKLLSGLPEEHPEVLTAHGISPTDYPLLFNSAIQSLRGTSAATTAEKRLFGAQILNFMKEQTLIADWQYLGTEGRNDYRVNLPNGRSVAIEAKGCPDGNNMTIYERPSWAEEFIIWSQCPNSLAKDPGEGVWSGLSTRLFPHMMESDTQRVDALIFYDGRCASSFRQCPYQFGINNGLREAATNIPGYPEADWMSAPCVYLLPRTKAHFSSNPKPPLTSLNDSQFVMALLRAFSVPGERMRGHVQWASVEVKQDASGRYRRVSLGRGLDNQTPVVQSGWQRVKRE